MLDKVRLFLPRGEYNVLDTSALEYLTLRASAKGEEQTGKLNNMCVCESCLGVQVWGSLQKYVQGDNIGAALTPKECAAALHDIGYRLNADMQNAFVTGFEFGANIEVSEFVKKYLDILGDKPRTKRTRVCTEGEGETLYYSTHSRQYERTIILYDKLAECRKRGGNIPTELQGKNLLRYELRFNKRISKQLGYSLNGKILCSAQWQNAMLQRWKEEFNNIEKNTEKKQMCNNGFTTAREAANYLFAYLAQGREVEIKNFLTKAKEDGKLNRYNMARLKKMLSDLPEVDEIPDHSRELYNEISHLINGQFVRDF